MQSTPKKTVATIVKSGNHYLAAVKGNQPKLYQAVQQHFVPKDTFEQINKGHGRIETRRVSISQACLNLTDWLAIKTFIKVESQRHTKHKIECKTRYYISDLEETAFEFYQRIRGYWGVENRVHYVRDVTQGEDKSRIRTTPLPQILTIARNLAINLYRNAGFANMAQAQRQCQFGIDRLLTIFRMK
jgi:predicted transposase YbfD/YdcC